MENISHKKNTFKEKKKFRQKIASKKAFKKCGFHL